MSFACAALLDTIPAKAGIQRTINCILFPINAGKSASLVHRRIIAVEKFTGCLFLYVFCLCDPVYVAEGPAVNTSVGFLISMNFHGQCFNPGGIQTIELCLM